MMLETRGVAPGYAVPALRAEERNRPIAPQDFDTPTAYYLGRSQFFSLEPRLTSRVRSLLSLYFAGRSSAVIGITGLSGVSYTFFLPTTLLPEMLTFVFPTGTFEAVYLPSLMVPPADGPLP